MNTEYLFREHLVLQKKIISQFAHAPSLSNTFKFIIAMMNVIVFFTFYDFWHPKFQLLMHSVLEKWSIDISADTVAGRMQSSKLFTRAKRVWLVQVEITKGVVYYTVMRFVRPETKIVRDGGGTAAYTVYTLYITYTASSACTYMHSLHSLGANGLLCLYISYIYYTWLYC